MKILIILLTVLVLDLAKAHPQGSSSSSQCRMINGQYKCIVQTCTYSPDGRVICGNSEGNNVGQSSQYNCDYRTDRCNHRRCTTSPYGHVTCY